MSIWAQHSAQDEKKVLNWNDFPAEPDVRQDVLVPEICAYMRRILEKYEESEFIKYLVLPSPMALSGFFHCTEQDVLAALKELHRQGYEYETAGSAGPITLWDPLVRRNTRQVSEPKPWQVFYETIFNPIRRPLTGPAQ